MKIIYKPRNSGKTTELIKIAAKGFYYIVCANYKVVQRIANQARDMKLDIPFPVTFDEFIRREYYARGVNGFVIDEADRLLQYMSSVPVDAITLTNYEDDDIMKHIRKLEEEDDKVYNDPKTREVAFQLAKKHRLTAKDLNDQWG